MFFTQLESIKQFQPLEPIYLSLTIWPAIFNLYILDWVLGKQKETLMRSVFNSPFRILKMSIFYLFSEIKTYLLAKYYIEVIWKYELLEANFNKVFSNFVKLLLSI